MNTIYIDGKMTNRTRAKECLELVNIDMYGPFCVYAWKVLVFHHLLIHTLGLDMCIVNLMPWINSLNLR